MTLAPPQLDWKIRLIGVVGGTTPLFGIGVRLLTASPLRIALSGLVLWSLGAASLGYLLRLDSSRQRNPFVAVAVWTIAPFIPLYVVMVLLTGALMHAKLLGN